MWIRTISEDEAEGALARAYQSAIQRAGRVYQIIKTMSLAPRIQKASLGLYREVMFDAKGLSRIDAELLAVVTSRANHCHY